MIDIAVKLICVIFILYIFYRILKKYNNKVLSYLLTIVEKK